MLWLVNTAEDILLKTSVCNQTKCRLKEQRLLLSVGEAVVHERIMVLWHCLWMLLLPSTWSPSAHAKYSSPPEVVIPLRVTDTSRYGISPDWLSYSLRFGGRRHIITMKHTKYFISRNFLLVTYSGKGNLLAEQPSVQSDYYLHGFIYMETQSPPSLLTPV